jgi:hypothetical protein
MTSYSIIALVFNIVSLVRGILLFEPRPTHIMFMGDKLALRHVFSAYVIFLSAVSFHQDPILNNRRYITLTIVSVVKSHLPKHNNYISASDRLFIVF